MNQQALIAVLDALDQHGLFVFTFNDLHKWFLAESKKTFKSSLRRHVAQGLLEHLCRNIYLNPKAKSQDSYTLEHIAKTLRKGEYNYVSLESLLSEIGVISQVPLNLLTIMTTGRSQMYQTPYGNIEFTHTKKKITDILGNTYKLQERPLRLATQETAIRDLRRVNRNTHLIDQEELGND